MKKNRLLPICFLVGLILLLSGAFAYMAARSLSISIGRCFIADNGTYMLIVDHEPICLSNTQKRETLFSGLETGDRILVLHDGIQETYPAHTGAYGILRLSGGTIEDIPNPVLDTLSELGWLSSEKTAASTSEFVTTAESAVSYANYYEGEQLYFSALNRDKFYISSVQHLPVFKFDTLEELNLFREMFRDSLTMTHGYDDIPSFDTVTNPMDDAFFAEFTLFLVYVPANSGSYRFALRSIYNDYETLCFHVERTNAPEEVTADMAGWFISVPLLKSETASCTIFDAALNHFYP